MRRGFFARQGRLVERRRTGVLKLRTGKGAPSLVRSLLFGGIVPEVFDG
jgi:hypothetical protein